MGVINLFADEIRSIKAIDTRELERLIDKAIDEERTTGLHRLPLAACGEYVSTELGYFERAIRDYTQSKSYKKQAETLDRARRAGRDLSAAVHGMQHRVEEDEKHGELFFVDDWPSTPITFSKNMNVRVSYRWRDSADGEWKHGSINFIHVADLTPDYLRPTPKRKPSSAQVERDRQEELSREYDYLMKGALYSVREYFVDGGYGSKISETFDVKLSGHSKGLNNYSTKFWVDDPKRVHPL